MARCGAMLGCAVVAVAGAMRQQHSPGSVETLAESQWTPQSVRSLGLHQTSSRDLVAATPAALGGEDAHYRTSRRLAEVLGLGDAAADTMAPQVDDDGARSRIPRPVSESLRLREGAAGAKALHADVAEVLGLGEVAADATGLQLDDDGTHGQLDDDGTHGRVLRPLVEVRRSREGDRDPKASQADVGEMLRFSDGVRALPLDAHAAHDRIARPLVELLKFRTRAAAAKASQVDVGGISRRPEEMIGLGEEAVEGSSSGEAPGRTFRPLAELLRYRAGAMDPPPEQVNYGEDEMIGTEAEDDDAFNFDAPQLAQEFASPLMRILRPLIQYAEGPMSMALISWAIYDKLRQALKFVVPKPFFEECEDYFRVVAGVDLQALETMKRILEGSEHLAYKHPRASKARDAALNYLAGEMWRGVQESADYALSIGPGAFQKLQRKGKRRELAVHQLALRIADALERDKGGKWRPVGKSIALNRRAAAEAAALDVSRELVPDHVAAKAKLSLLGLVASLGHESVFRKVQEAVGHNASQGPPMSIEEFKAKMGVNGTADLVKKLVHKYATPRAYLRTYLALYTLFPLRHDSRYFHIAWGIGFASHLATRHLKHPFAQIAGKRGLFLFYHMEAAYRGAQFIELARMVRLGVGIGRYGHLLAAQGFLTMLLFLTDTPVHLLG